MKRSVGPDNFFLLSFHSCPPATYSVPLPPSLLNHPWLVCEQRHHVITCKQPGVTESDWLDPLSTASRSSCPPLTEPRVFTHCRFAHVKELTKMRKMKLQESLRMHQFFYDVADEESWIGWVGRACLMRTNAMRWLLLCSESDLHRLVLFCSTYI